MDDATYTHLVKKRITVHTPPTYNIEEYKTKIIELTNSLFEHKMTGSIQAAFDMYIHECISHLTQKDSPPVELPPALPADMLMVKPKKVLHYMYKKK